MKRRNLEAVVGIEGRKALICCSSKVDLCIYDRCTTSRGPQVELWLC